MSVTQSNLPASVVGYVRKYMAQNYWRCADYYELDDLIQDGLVCAWRCRQLHPEFDDKQLMGAVKTAVYNCVGDVVRKKMKTLDNLTSNILDIRIKSDEPITNENQVLDRLNKMFDMPLAELAVYVSELPEWVRKLLDYLSTKEGTDALLRVRPNIDGPNKSKFELIQERVRRLTGMPEDTDFEAELLAYFS